MRGVYKMKYVQQSNQTLLKEDGSVLVIFTIFLIVLFGFAALVIDYGGLKLEERRLVNVVDAAALAGAWELPNQNQAENVAKEYAEYNGASDQEITVTFPNHGEIQVEARREKEYFFGRAIGTPVGNARAVATAIRGSVSSAKGIAPFGIPEQILDYGVEYELKSGDINSPGNFGALALGGRGARIYRDNIKYGYGGIVRIGDTVETQPGNISGPTSQGVNYRINRCTHTPACTFDEHHRECERIIIIPVYEPQVSQGRDEVVVSGFAAFFLKGVDGQGNQSIVRGNFIEMVPEGYYVEIDPDQDSYGMEKVKLIQ